MDIHVVNGISNTAIIHKSAIIGEGTSIGTGAIIGENVKIGKNCKIGPYVVIEKNVTIGDNVKIFTGAIIGSDPQDLKYKGEETFLEIGDNTIIREYVTINRGTTENYKTVIGKNCLLLSYCHVAHDCIIGDNVIMSNNATLAGHCKVGSYAVLSGFSVFHQFTRIGDFCFVQGTAKVNKDLPPFAMIGADPLRFAGINVEKLKRLNYDKQIIEDISNIYKIIYDKGLMKDKLKVVKEKYKDKEYAQLIVNFIENSERGIVFPIRN